MAKPHTTESEMKFVAGLAKIGHIEYKNNYSARQALQNYISAAEKRNNWDGMDKVMVIGYARALLSGCM